jgi:hypothetical protein
VDAGSEGLSTGQKYIAYSAGFPSSVSRNLSPENLSTPTAFRLLGVVYSQQASAGAEQSPASHAGRARQEAQQQRRFRGVLASTPLDVQVLVERGHSDGESGERQRAATSGGKGL